MIEPQARNRWAGPITAVLGLMLVAGSAARSAQYDAMGIQPTNDLSLVQFLKWGPFDVHPSMSASTLYNDNIYINTSTNVQSDFIWVGTPGVVVGLGDYLARQENLMLFHYMPSLIVYTDHSENNNINQDLSLFGQWHIARLTLGLRQDYQTFSEAYADAANQVDRSIYTTSLTSHYEVGGKTALNVNLQLAVNDNKGYLSYNDWRDDNSLNYQISEKVNLGAGLTFGYQQNDNNSQQSQPNQTTEQVSLRGSYQLTGKVSFQFSVGGELRQIDGGNNQGITPVFSLGFSYQPFDATSVSLQTYRYEQSSISVSGQNYTTTGFSVSVRQRFFQKYFLTVAGGYDEVNYRSTVSNGTPGRDDQDFFTRDSLDWNVTTKWTVGMFYQYRQRDSSDKIYGYKNNQVGLHTSYSF